MLEEGAKDKGTDCLGQECGCTDRDESKWEKVNHELHWLVLVLAISKI
jgi:hypothetical protein